MGAANPKPGALIFGRTAGGENLPVAVNDDGTLDVSVSPAASSSQAINDGVTTTRKASVLESTATPGTFGLVALASDGSDISGGGGGGGAVTVADGADVAQGATTDAKVTGDNSGTTEAKLRGLNYLWALVIDTVNSWVKVSIQNASIAVTGTFWQATQPVSVASLPLPTGASTLAEQQSQTSVLGATTGSAVVTDSNGTIQQYLRGLVKMASTAGSFLVTAAISAGTNLIGYIGLKLTYGTKTTITMTLTSLANGSAWQSTVVDNTSDLFRNVRIRVQTKGQASGTATLDFYVYSSLSDSTYTDLATGTDGSFTAANRFNAIYIGSIRLNANTTAVVGELFLSAGFGTAIPSKWGLIAINSSGAALSATAGDHVIEYQGIY